MRLLKKENAIRDMKKDADEIEKKLLERASQEVKFLDDASTVFWTFIYFMYYRFFFPFV
jgi:hypothetical protein